MRALRLVKIAGVEIGLMIGVEIGHMIPGQMIHGKIVMDGNREYL